MNDENLLEFLHIIEKMKCTYRHSWTSVGRRESVAEHSFRLAVLCLLTEDELIGVDKEKLLRMCIIHDFGEAICGDVPSFEKTENDDKREAQAIDEILLSKLSDKKRAEFSALFKEMREGKSREAKIWRALDMMEAAIQHNEAPLSTWLELEHELNPIYGYEEAQCEPYLAQLRERVRQDSLNKLENEK